MKQKSEMDLEMELEMQKAQLEILKSQEQKEPLEVQKTFNIEIIKSDDEDNKEDDINGVVRFILSNEDVDRQGDIVEIGAWRLDGFKGMPLLYGHNRSDPDALMGHVSKLYPEGKNLIGEASFSKKQTAQDIRQDVIDGHIRKVSANFAVYKYDYITNEKGMITGRRFTDVEPLEGSIVPVPANSQADILSAKAIIDEANKAKVDEINKAKVDEANKEAKQMVENKIKVLDEQVLKDLESKVTNNFNASLLEETKVIESNIDGIKKSLETKDKLISDQNSKIDAMQKALDSFEASQKIMTIETAEERGYKGVMKDAYNNLNVDFGDPAFASMRIAGKEFTEQEKVYTVMMGNFFKAAWGFSPDGNRDLMRKPNKEAMDMVVKILWGNSVEKAFDTTAGTSILIADIRKFMIKLLDEENELLRYVSEWNPGRKAGNAGTMPVEKTVTTTKRVGEKVVIKPTDGAITKATWARKTLATISIFTDEMVTGTDFSLAPMLLNWIIRGISNQINLEMVTGDPATAMQGFWYGGGKVANPMISYNTWIDSTKAGSLKNTNLSKFLTARNKIPFQYWNKVIAMTNPALEEVIGSMQNATTEGYLVNTPTEKITRQLWGTPLIYNSNVPIKTYKEKVGGVDDTELYMCILFFDPSYYYHVRLSDFVFDATAEATIDTVSMYDTRQNAIRVILQNDGVMTDITTVSRLIGIDNFK